MKNKMTLVAALLMLLTVSGQDITGDWHGYLKEFQLRIVFHITETENGLRSTMDSPDQGANGIPVSETRFEDSLLTINAPNLGLTFKGKLIDDALEGTFSQGGMQLPLKLTREVLEKPIAKRPQEPKEPFPYYIEEVTFRNEDADISLAGTLTLPDKTGKFPAVVLITGSGPQDRNEELMGHKPFLVLADHLTRNGIAVLRYDDRGFGKSTGEFNGATSADFATDVQSAMDYLKTRKEIDPSKIGLIGHSEGGFIAPMVAAKSKDIGYIVLLAGPGLRGDKLIVLQQEVIARASGIPEEDIQVTKEFNTKVFKMVLESDNLETLKSDLNQYMTQALENEAKNIVPKGTTAENFIKTQINIITTPWLVGFVKHDPAPVLEKVSCPVLALNGEKDVQVPPKANLPLLEQALLEGGNQEGTFLELPGLNHLFQESETGLPNEYGIIEQTFAPSALKVISDWIVTQTK